MDSSYRLYKYIYFLICLKDIRLYKAMIMILYIIVAQTRKKEVELYWNKVAIFYQY